MWRMFAFGIPSRVCYQGSISPIILFSPSALPALWGVNPFLNTKQLNAHHIASVIYTYTYVCVCRQYHHTYHWRIIALECCGGLCHTLMLISHHFIHTHTHTHLSSWVSLSFSPNSTPLDCHRAPGWAPCVIQKLPISYLFYTWQCIYVSVTSSVCPTLTFPHCVH